MKATPVAAWRLRLCDEWQLYQAVAIALATLQPGRDPLIWPVIARGLLLCPCRMLPGGVGVCKWGTAAEHVY